MSTSPATSSQLPAAQHPVWLARLGDIFTPVAQSIWKSLGVANSRLLAGDLHQLTFENPIDLTGQDAACFLRWIVPVHHNWPTHPTQTQAFVEKAAQGLLRKFGNASPVNVLVTSLYSDPQSRAMASNLRGRALQVFHFEGRSPAPEGVDPDGHLVVALVGPQGLQAGLTTARRSKSYYGSGVRYVNQSDEAIVSRAGAKIVEGLMFLRLCKALPAEGLAIRWLELGASPGGMTAELLKRGFAVTAIDRAALSPALRRHAALDFRRTDVATFAPDAKTPYGALLCDMNGPWEHSSAEVFRLSHFLTPGAPVVFTLKFNAMSAPLAVLEAVRRLHSLAAAQGLIPLLTTHSTYNRNELTCIFQKIFQKGHAAT
jgi:23S rRNA (cytidine2498-2'-O)-methyltransferase